MYQLQNIAYDFQDDAIVFQRVNGIWVVSL